MRRISINFFLLCMIGIVISCSNHPKYDITVENIPDSSDYVKLYIFDSIYNACRELGHQPTNKKQKQVNFQGNISEPTLAYISLQSDSNKYYFVIDTVPTVLRMPISGNCMNVVEGSEDNMALEHTYRQVKSLIFQHNSVFSEYEERMNDSTFTKQDEARVIVELADIDRTVYDLITESNASLSEPYKYLNRLRYETIRREIEPKE